MKTTRQKWTCVARRGWPHLLAFILEDTDHTLFDPQHSMYRRLRAKQKQELMALLRWIAEQAEREGIKTAALQEQHAAKHATFEDQNPRLFQETSS